MTTMELSSSLSEASNLVGVPELSKSITRINFTPSPNSIVHKRILQTEARIHGQENNGVIATTQQYSKSKSPVLNRSKGKEDQQQQQGSKEEQPAVEPKSSGRHHHHQHHSHRRHSDLMAQGVPKTIRVSGEHHSPEEEKTNTYHLDMLKEKKLKVTRSSEHSATKSQESQDSSVSSSRERLERLGTLLTKARGNCQTAQTRISSMVDDGSMAECKTTDEVQTILQQDNQVYTHRHSYAGPENTTRNNALSEISRLKARLQIVKNEKANRAVAIMSHSKNRKAKENWMVSHPPPPPPPPSPPSQQGARNSEHYLNRLVAKETHYIQTEYQESESKTDENGVKVESRLCSQVRMAIQQNELGANDPRLDDPIFRLVFLAKELADQAARIDFTDEYFPRMNPVVPSLPPSMSRPLVLHNRESFPSMDSSFEKIYGPLPPMTDDPTGSMPPLQYLLKKLQESEANCLELQRNQAELEASLLEANNVRRDLEASVQAYTEELEEARANNVSLSDELATAREEIAALTDGNNKLEDELERTLNRLGDISVQVSDLELESNSLRQMVDEKDKDIDESMALLKDQHKSVVGVIDNAREIRRLMTELKEKLQPKNDEDSENGKDPTVRAQEAWEAWLKETLPQMDAMENALIISQMQLAVKVLPPEDDANDHHEESPDTAKGRWGLFRFKR